MRPAGAKANGKTPGAAPGAAQAGVGSGVTPPHVEVYYPRGEKGAAGRLFEIADLDGIYDAVVDAADDAALIKLEVDPETGKWVLGETRGTNALLRVLIIDAAFFLVETKEFRRREYEKAADRLCEWLVENMLPKYGKMIAWVHDWVHEGTERLAIIAVAYARSQPSGF